MERAEAIKIIKTATVYTPEEMEALETLIPELKESEDERTRKELIDFINHYRHNTDLTSEQAEWCKKVLAYLEKQKEQKPNIELIQRSWYMEGYHDREFGREPKWIIKTGEGGPKHELNPRYGQPIGGEQKPAEWSEEDEKMRDRIIDILNRTFSVYSALGTSSTRPSCPTYKDEIDWLKSLRPSWKPTRLQLKALEVAGRFFASFKDQSDTMRMTWETFHEPLESLGKDLVKLMR